MVPQQTGLNPVDYKILGVVQQRVFEIQIHNRQTQAANDLLIEKLRRVLVNTFMAHFERPSGGRL